MHWRSISCAQGKRSLYSRWNVILTFIELHDHGGERWPTEVTSKTYFCSVVAIIPPYCVSSFEMTPNKMVITSCNTHLLQSKWRRILCRCCRCRTGTESTSCSLAWRNCAAWWSRKISLDCGSAWFETAWWSLCHSRANARCWSFFGSALWSDNHVVHWCATCTAGSAGRASGALVTGRSQMCASAAQFSCRIWIAWRSSSWSCDD